MPESKVRKEAKAKARKKQAEELVEARSERKRLKNTGDRKWVPFAFISVGVLGALWMVVWNLAGSEIGFMRSLGDWNVLIAIGLIIASFMLATLWK
ncbi:cell division protein CrgA [Arachnia propionica]|uniref:cell division protein CrgA n=1 Tax=Arachnia propionica TaxID=1750 RepID=UPI00163A2D14|nr:cell division protein CrgA [Arachnia propionica]MDO5084170.1 cell division protein CrgA [Arachnia propionica]